MVRSPGHEAKPLETEQFFAPTELPRPGPHRALDRPLCRAWRGGSGPAAGGLLAYDRGRRRTAR